MCKHEVSVRFLVGKMYEAFTFHGQLNETDSLSPMILNFYLYRSPSVDKIVRPRRLAWVEHGAKMWRRKCTQYFGWRNSWKKGRPSNAKVIQGQNESWILKR